MTEQQLQDIQNKIKSLLREWQDFDTCGWNKEADAKRLEAERLIKLLENRTPIL